MNRTVKTISGIAWVVSLFALPNLLPAATTQPSDGPTTKPSSLPFESEIRAFEKADKRQMPPANATLFVGSSSIRFWTTLATDFPEFPTINRGFGGSRIVDSTYYADRIIVPYHPSRIVFYAGDNDIADGRTPEQVEADFQAFVRKVRSELPDTPIYFISIKPSLLRWLLVDKIRAANALIEHDIAADPSLHYVDVFTAMLGPDGKPRRELFRWDGLHMVRKGYELWISILKPVLISK
jgi:lysophospholipase L1-like esterase